MATASTPSSTSSPKDGTAGASGSLLTRLWNAFQRHRRRGRKRSLSTVRFRLTREGIHFIGILTFIFIGAVIRDINLLILLAGAMIGLLLLQWRFNKSTLVGLNFSRRIPRNTTVGAETEIETTVTNPKSWLGAWLVLLEDRIIRTTPSPVRIRAQGTVLLDSVKPQGRTKGRYRLVFHDRGKYEVGPTTMTTRFPMGLGRGWRILENTSSIVVHPRVGTLLPSIRMLFDQDQHGSASSKASSGTQEGDFFGIRPWATGDSRRWIHWRTTARLGELSVRQFEQQMQPNTCIVLDLCDATEDKAACEQAISFVATLARYSVNQSRVRLAVGMAGETISVCSAVQSRVLVENLLDQLAVVEPTPEPDLVGVLRELMPVLIANPNVVVISTRPDASAELLAGEDAHLERLLHTVRLRWLDVSNGDLESYFRLEHSIES